MVKIWSFVEDIYWTDFMWLHGKTRSNGYDRQKDLDFTYITYEKLEISVGRKSFLEIKDRKGEWS
jgi:hypothetical protein